MIEYTDEDMIEEINELGGYAKQQVWYITRGNKKVGIGLYGYCEESGGGYVYYIISDHIDAFSSQIKKLGHKCEIRPFEDCEDCLHEDIWYKRLIRKRYLPVKIENQI